ncbi:metallophosphoesterase [Paenibacillus sp. y28]
MDRRNFLKRLFAIAAFLAVGGLGWFKLGRPAWSPVPVQPDSGPAGGVEAEQPRTADGTGPLLSLFLLSDVHINPDLGGPSEHLKQSLDDVTKSFGSAVNGIIFTGDLADYGRETDYNELRSVLKRYKLPPIHANMGNHDYYDIWMDQSGGFNRDTMPNGKTDSMCRERFQRFMGYMKPYNEAVINGYPVLLLSQECYVQEKPSVGEGAWYSDEQLAWFKQKMAEYGGKKPVFVMIHQPLPPKGQDGGNHTLIRAKAFREILKPYPDVFVFSGHNHRDFIYTEDHYVKETFHWFHNSSVSRVLNRKYQLERPDSSQGLYVEVYADRVHLRGREFSTREWIAGAEWTVPLTSATL